nr:MAG TPA: hypothetical protein [Caudoviricetes sp.]
MSYIIYSPFTKTILLQKRSKYLLTNEASNAIV